MKPEEEIRQRLIRKMTLRLGFPRGFLLVEKAVSSLPHRPKAPAGRRFDLVCLAKEIHPGYPLYPLLLVECKAADLGQEAERQAFGYNEAVGAPFICLANGQGEKTFWREGEQVVSVPFLPLFSELLEKIRWKPM